MPRRQTDTQSTSIDHRLSAAEERRAADRALVARLISGEDSAWSEVAFGMVSPLFKADVKGIRSQCSKAGIDEGAVISRLYVNLMRENCAPLRAFRFECAFRSWIYWHVWDAAQGAIREISNRAGGDMSDVTELESLKDMNAPVPDESASARESRESLNVLLAELWKENPMRAIVLLLRGELDLSSREVGAFLGKDPSNVDQIHHRAQTSMRRLRLSSEKDSQV